ncbi:uridine kinase [Guggenheimella bovis]
MNPFIVGIAGGSASGKSSVVEKIKENLKENVLILSLDSYYKSFDEMTFEEKLKVNYDHPDAFELDLLLEDLRKLKEGLKASIPVYDFVKYVRKEEKKTLEGKPVIIVEGLFALYDERIRELLDLKVFVDCDSDVRLIRRIRRDAIERGRSTESVLNQYESQVKPMHETFVEPSKRYAHVILPEGAENTVGLKLLIDTLKKEKKRRTNRKADIV